MLDFSTINNEVRSYLLGFIYADGNLTYDSLIGSYRLRFHLGIKDIDYLQKIKNYLGSNHKIQKRKNSVMLEISNKKLCDQLLLHGVHPKKTFTITPPITVPKDLLHHWVRGYFDGDGSVYFSSGKLSASIVGNSDIIDFIREVFLLEYPNKSSLLKNRNSFRVVYAGQTGLYFLRWIYNNASIYLERKYNLFMQGEEQYDNRSL